MARPHNTPDIFRAVAHPVRRKMLDLLRQRPRTVAELAQPFHLTLGTITEHVRALRVAGVVTYRSRGPKHEYALVRDRLRPVEEWIAPFTKQTPQGKAEKQNLRSES